MTTPTTPDYSALTITVHLSDGDVLDRGRPTTEATDRLAQQTADAIAAEYPGASVRVPVRRHTSGGGGISVEEDPGVDADGLQNLHRHDEELIREDVHEISERTWMAWSETLAAEEVE